MGPPEPPPGPPEPPPGTPESPPGPSEPYRNFADLEVTPKNQ